MIYNRNGFNFTFNCFTTLPMNEKKRTGNGLDNMQAPVNFLMCYLSQRINSRVFTKWCFKTSAKEAGKKKVITRTEKNAMSFRYTFPLFSFPPPRLWHYYPIFIPLHFILSYVQIGFWTFLCLENIFLFEGESVSEFVFD